MEPVSLVMKEVGLSGVDMWNVEMTLTGSHSDGC